MNDLTLAQANEDAEQARQQFPIGKYKGRLVKDVCWDKNYLSWFHKEFSMRQTKFELTGEGYDNGALLKEIGEYI